MATEGTVHAKVPKLPGVLDTMVCHELPLLLENSIDTFVRLLDAHCIGKVEPFAKISPPLGDIIATALRVLMLSAYPSCAPPRCLPPLWNGIKKAALETSEIKGVLESKIRTKPKPLIPPGIVQDNCPWVAAI